jgi:hypothetical protein
VIHLYAFTYPGAPLPVVAGIDGGELETCPLDGIAAVVGNVETGSGREAVLAHGLVVEALRDVTPAVLPVRFGERFADRSALRDAVGPRVQALRAGLARVEGCAEFGVRMMTEEETHGVTQAADGSTYMRARLASLERADAVAAELHRPLARCARATVLAPGTDHAAAYLVRNEERPAFERTLAGFVSAHPEVTVVCTGPWAPYSFAEAA